HARGAAVLHLHEAPALQPLHRFADARAVDLVLLGQLALAGERISRAEAALHDGDLQRIGNAFGDGHDWSDQLAWIGLVGPVGRLPGRWPSICPGWSDPWKLCYWSDQSCSPFFRSRPVKTVPRCSARFRS